MSGAGLPPQACLHPVHPGAPGPGWEAFNPAGVREEHSRPSAPGAQWEITTCVCVCVCVWPGGCSSWLGNKKAGEREDGKRQEVAECRVSRVAFLCGPKPQSSVPLIVTSEDKLLHLCHRAALLGFLKESSLWRLDMKWLVQATPVSAGQDCNPKNLRLLFRLG